MKSPRALLILSLLVFCGYAAAAPAKSGPKKPAAEYTGDRAAANQGSLENIPQKRFTIEYGPDTFVVDDPRYGVIVLSKDRWKNWVERAAYLLLIYLAIAVTLWTMPKAEEYSILASYVLSGVNFTISFWVFLCAVLLFKFKAMAWTYTLLVSFLMFAGAFAVLMKIKKADISLEDTKEKFQKLSRTEKEDPRLSAIDGAPGDWEGEDFLS